MQRKSTSSIKLISILIQKFNSMSKINIIIRDKDIYIFLVSY